MLNIVSRAQERALEKTAKNAMNDNSPISSATVSALRVGDFNSPSPFIILHLLRLLNHA